MRYKGNSLTGFTLVELVIAVVLLSMVMLTAVTLELSLRKMQIRPENQVRLLDELIPVLERIELDFGKQIGALYNSSVEIQDSGRRLAIRVDSNNDGKISVGDDWHAYRWNTTTGNIEYSPNNFTGLYEIIGYGITDFCVSEPQSNLNSTALKIEIKTKKNPSAPENPLTNPGVNLTTTIYSRMASGH